MKLIKRILYQAVYLLLFIIGFSLLDSAHILDTDTTSRSEAAAKFIVMIIVLAAITQWGMKFYTWLTGYKK